MQSSNRKKSSVKKNINYKLSKEAIIFLDNQLVNDGEKKLIQIEFIFQIIYAIKNLDNWYNCSLMDQNCKYGGFCIRYQQRYGEPKEGDIIKTSEIQIVKIPNRDTNLYFCDKVKKLEESKKMLVNPKSIESIVKIRSTSKKKVYQKYNIFQNYHEEEDINVNNLKSPNQERFLNLDDNNLLSNSKNKVENVEKPTLISELTAFVNHPFFILKFLAKTGIIVFESKFNSIGMEYVQNYIFSDINGDKIQGVSYTYDKTEELDKFFKEKSIYKISNATKKTKFKKDYSYVNGNIQLLFTYYTKIEELTAEEKKDMIFKDKIEFTKIKEIKNGLNKIYDICGIVLEDKGIIEKKKNKGDDIVKYRRLIIGDDSLHRVNLKLWEDKIEPKKYYLKGDIICVRDVKYKLYYNYYELNSIFFSKIEYYGETNLGKSLKKFFREHHKLDDYKDMSFVELNSDKNIQSIFISDFYDDYNEEMKKLISNKLAKIDGTVVDIEHSETNVFSGCKNCYIKFDDVCPTCGMHFKKLYFDYIIKIVDCSNYLWINLFGEIAENFLGIKPEEYQILIKNNNKHKLDKINKRFLYHQFTFIGRYISPNSDELKRGGFSVIKYNKLDNDYFKQLMQKLKSDK